MLQTKEFLLGEHIFRVATLTTHSEAVFYHPDRDFDDALPYISLKSIFTSYSD